MTTVICPWDGSDQGYPPDDSAAHGGATAAGEIVRGRWSFGATRQRAAAGDRVFLLRQGQDRGIVASGRLADGDIFEAPHYSGDGRTAFYVWVDWDRVLPVDDRLDLEVL